MNNYLHICIQTCGIYRIFSTSCWHLYIKGFHIKTQLSCFSLKWDLAFLQGCSQWAAPYPGGRGFALLRLCSFLPLSLTAPLPLELFRPLPHGNSSHPQDFCIMAFNLHPPLTGVCDPNSPLGRVTVPWEVDQDLYHRTWSTFHSLKQILHQYLCA